MYRKRRNKQTWFPVLPTQYDEDTPQLSFYETSESVSFTAQTRALGGVGFSPVIPDYTVTPEDATNPDQTLADYTQGQDYFLRRIVGKVWGGPCLDPAGPPDWVIGMGFAIVPVSDNGQPDFTDPSDLQNTYSPISSQASTSPWIWRRTWRLTNSLSTEVGEGLAISAPPTIQGCGSVMDGGHVDAKTMRRVRKHERLFWFFQAWAQAADELNNQYDYVVGVDVRALGSMRRSSNKSTFR